MKKTITSQPNPQISCEANNLCYFLGIDGGGTKTVFRLTDENGAVIREILLGAVNPNDIGMENAMSVLKKGITEICRDIAFSDVTMFAGIAGGGLSGNNLVILKHFFEQFGFFAFDNGSDIENTIALSEDEPRVHVIMGTGFIVYALNEDFRKRIGGWGQFFDEGGSGYTLGRDAVTAVLCEGDGSGKPTALTALLEKRIGETAEAHLTQFYRKGKSYIAGFSDLVFEAAESGDPIATDILEKNMAFAAQRIDAACNALAHFRESTRSIPVFFSGGISRKSDVIFPLIQSHLNTRTCSLIRLDADPVEGAVRRAQKLFELKIKENQS